MQVWDWAEFWIVADGENVIAVVSSESDAHAMVSIINSSWDYYRARAERQEK